MYNRYLKLWIVFVACVLFVLGASIRAGATVLARKNLNNLVEEAELILEGTVMQKESVWAEDKSTIYTFVTLSDLEVIDGAYEGNTFTLRMDGGEVEEAGRVKGLKIPGTPEFEIEDRVILFIRNNAWEVCPLVGWDQGAFKVKEDPITKKTKLFHFHDEAEIVGIDNNSGDLSLEPHPLLLDMIVPEPVDDDPVANEMRRKYEQERRDAGKLNKPSPREFTSQDFKRLTKDKVGILKSGGKKYSRAAQNADIRIHRQGRSLKSVQLLQEGQGGNQ